MVKYSKFEVGDVVKPNSRKNRTTYIISSIEEDIAYLKPISQFSKPKYISIDALNAYWKLVYKADSNEGVFAGWVYEV